MSAEYTGKNDADKTVPLLPRPLRSVRQRMRAQNLTGDPTGSSPHDTSWWNGSSDVRGQQLAAEQAARQALEDAIDSAWYD